MSSLQEKLKMAPQNPGVYIMKNAMGKIIYIGKAKILKNRLKSYFTNKNAQGAKVQALVSNITDFEYIITTSELEALILECNLIKKHKPKYNILLKDDKTYPYLKITWQEDFPRIYATRRQQPDGSRYFGPFVDVGAMYETLELIKQTFKLRSCKTMPKGRACLRYYIGKCCAPCQGKVAKEEYRAILANVCLFLEGRSDSLLTELKQKIAKAAAELNFEAAIVLKEQLQAVTAIQQKQKVVTQTQDDADIIGFAVGGDLGCVQVLMVRSGKLIGQNFVYLKNTATGEEGELLSEFVKQYYSKATFIPQEIIMPVATEENELLQTWLTMQAQKSVRIHIPQRGQKRSLLAMAQENAGVKLQEAITANSLKEQVQQENLYRLAEYLGLSKLPIRIECFDISHNQGQQTVASMVVFVDGQPSKRDYKKYKLHTVEGKPDDFLSMKEVISRRYLKKENMPDLIVIDGGKGQLSSVCEILNEYDIHVPVISLAKEFEHIFIPNVSYPIVLERNDPALHILQNIRNEAHRFAITYHRQLRNKRNITSILQHIDGVGSLRHKALLKHFKSIDAIKKASVDDLCAVEGINRNVAENIYTFFHEG